MSKTEFETIVRQEMAHLKKVHPKVEDIPSCMTLLDTFLSCHREQSHSDHDSVTALTRNTLGPVVNNQLKSLYRYGHMSECAQKNEDFKFCMSNKSLHEEDKYEAWIRHRAEWWAKRRLAKSSENIWEARTYVSSLLSILRLPPHLFAVNPFLTILALLLKYFKT
jgi:hypothetical protein